MKQQTFFLRQVLSCIGFLFLSVVFISSCSAAVDEIEPKEDEDIPEVVTTTRYYIDNNGDDANDGLSPNTAWKTLAKVNGTVFEPGDSILFKRGNSWEGTLIIKSAGTSSERITFSAYGTGQKPQLIGNNSNLAVVSIQNPKYLTFENFDVSHPNAVRPPNKSLCGIYASIANDGVYPDVVIRNNDIHDVEGTPITNRHMQAGIFVRSNAAQGQFENLLIEGNNLERCSSRGIIMGDGSNKDTTYYNNNVVIRENVINRTAMEGIIVYTTKNILIEHNKVFNAGAYTLGVDMNTVLAGLWGRGKNMIIQYNEVAYTRLTNPADYASMDSEAFDIDLGSPGYQIIQYNYSHDNEGGFFLHMGNPGDDFTYGIVRYNISQNDGNGFNNRTFELHGHPNGKKVPIYIYNNTIYNDKKIGVLDRGGNGIHPGLEFKNNIFYAPQLQFDDPENILYENNLYYSGAKAGNDKSAIVSNPLFYTPGSGGDGMNTVSGYKLKETSPAVGSGLIISDNGGKDFFGNSVTNSNKPSIGAFQLNK